MAASKGEDNSGGDSDGGFVPYVAHEEFRNGLPFGRFRVVMHPTLAKAYVVQRTRINVLALVVIGVGAALALAGQAAAGGVLVVLGIAANRLVRHQTGRILLHLATRDPAVYAEVTSTGVMEVRRSS